MRLREAPADAAARCIAKGSQITVDDAYEDGDARDALVAEECSLGGEVVTPVGTCANGRVSALEFGAYAPRR